MFLVYTGLNRFSNNIEEDKIKNLDRNIKNLDRIKEILHLITAYLNTRCGHVVRDFESEAKTR